MALADLQQFTDIDANVVAFWNLQEASATDIWDNGEGTSGWDITPNSGNEPQISTTVVNANFTRSKIGDNNDFGLLTDPGFPTGAFTFEAIVRGDDTPTDTEAIAAQYPTSAGDRSFYIQYLTNRKIDFGITNNGTAFFTVVSTTATTGGQFHYIVCVFEPSTAIRIYIDGTLDASNTTSIPATIKDSASVIAFMRYNATWGGVNALDGLVQAMRISNIARDATFISNVWAGVGGGSPVTYRSPSQVAYSGGLQMY